MRGGVVDVNYKNLNEFNRCFKLKFGYFGLYLEININDPNFLFHISKCMQQLTYQHFVHLKFDTLKKYFSLDCQCAKYCICLV